MRIHQYHFQIGKNLLHRWVTLKEIKLFYETMSGKKLQKKWKHKNFYNVFQRNHYEFQTTYIKRNSFYQKYCLTRLIKLRVIFYIKSG